MKKLYPVPDETRRLQATASDPRHSAWVSANAGSGKTHVLSKRVIRLLLEGTDPGRILCLTYTKAAAANMSNRVFRELARWTVLDDAELEAEIAALEERKPDAERLKRARQLFARALETPGGLKIQTIHAFCEAVLHQFPLEANIAGHFELLDGKMETALVAEARREMLSGVAGGDYPDLAEAFAEVLALGGEAGLEALLSEIVRKRDEIRTFLDAIGGTATGFAPLFAEFGLSAADTAESIASELWPDPCFGIGLARAFVSRALAAGKTMAEDFGRKLLWACEAENAVERVSLLRDAFLTRKQNGYEARSTRSILSKGVAEHFPGLDEEFGRLARSVLATSDRLALFEMLNATRAALIVADRLIARYERLKSARGFLDFNDLIGRTIRLLARPDAGLWVQYRLDKGIDHILVDEAQDTSPGQWTVIRSLAEEFFAGKGARDNVHRTVFAVGDEKQSIYSFQGAEPSAFGETRSFFAQKITGAGKGFEAVRLKLSFRSTGDVLQAVDRVFESEANRKGLTRDPEPVGHEAIRFDAPGYVEIWPSIAATAIEEPDDWAEPIDHASAPAVLLAERIAAKVKGWITGGERIDGTGKRVSAGDVLVLVRKRDRFVHALSRALKNRHVPVAGADRLDLQAHIAVKDLAALGRFVLQPADDLSLAALLRSPIFGLSEERLFDIAWDRGHASLHASLLDAAETDAALGEIARMLQRWRDEVDFLPVFEFYSGILGRDGVRRRLLQRLGHEAGEILDEFLNFCLAEERTGLPGLEAFLATLENSGPEIKREMDQGRDEVRVMTVHAAKGLEAPIVFLVDSGGAPFSPSHLPRLCAFESDRTGWVGSGFLWRASADLANGHSRRIAARFQEKAEEEYRRLLYVGMTRAEDRLIVCGYHGKRGQNPGAWHALVEGALAGHAEEVGDPASGATVRRYRVTPVGAVPEPPADPARVARIPPLPSFDDLPAPPAMPRPLSPSGVSALIGEQRETEASTTSPVLDPVAEPSFSVSRGIAIHRLLQMLPGVGADAREAAARRYLARFGRDWEEEQREAAWRSAAAILSDPAFAPVFAQGSRAEVAVMGTLRLGSRDHAVSAKIDRVAVSGGRVLIVDYKTNRPPPASLAEVSPSHVAQMALYRELLAPIYPGKRVEAALLYTEAPRLIALADAALAESLARLTRS